MIEFDRSLLSYAERVLMSRDISPDYATKVRYCLRKFCDWLGCDPGIDGLECQAVNEYLQHLHSLGKKPDTVAGYRRAILVIWNAAFSDGDIGTPPLRVRKVRCPRDTVEAYTHEQLKSLLLYAGRLQKFFPNGVRESVFWTGAIHSAYSTGLRRGDLLRVRLAQIGKDGIARVMQNKTGYLVTVKFSKPAMKAILQMRVNEHALPWPYHSNALSRQFRRLANRAAVGGQFRWIRRAAGSYCDSEHPGSGPKLLGHRREQTFRDFYDAPAITQQQPPSPPPL